MPRRPRIEDQDAVYHVMSRGIRREELFVDDEDKRMFLRTLEESLHQTGWVVHAYVLMSNHYHMLVETPEANLSTGMQWFHGTYAKRFKARHRLLGPVFNNRFKSQLVQPDDSDYFRRVADYIHLNPARAKRLTKKPPELAGYVWSSFPLYVGPKRQRPAWLECRRVLDGDPRLGDSVRGRRDYRDELEERAQEGVKGKVKEEEKRWKGIRRGWYLGDTSFRERLEERLDGVLEKRKRSSYVGEAVRRHDEREAEKLLQESLKVLGVEPDGLGELPKSDIRKQGVAWLLKRRTVMSSEWIGSRLVMGSRTNLFLAVKTYESPQAKKVVKKYRRKLERLMVNK